MSNFYDQLAPFYHLIYKDWEASIASQANYLNVIIQAELGSSALYHLPGLGFRG